MQLVGRPFDEPTLLRLGWAYQQETAFPRRAPPPA
jgi:aspartyl-tRNA(Asn)/glutamyl-tRNA(Gln) amidotransferase subunit A